MEEIKEHLLIKSLVNGLISTAVIWVFWTPFLIFMAAPLMNAMIKDFLCRESWRIGTEIYEIFGIQAFEIYETNIPNPPIVANRVINNNTQNFLSENLNLFIIFGILSFFVIYFSLSLAGNLITKYNLNLREIILFNIVMAIIIIGIEIGFFAGVTTEYSPFNLKSVFSGLTQKIKDLLVPLSIPNK